MSQDHATALQPEQVPIKKKKKKEKKVEFSAIGSIANALIPHGTQSSGIKHIPPYLML